MLALGRVKFARMLTENVLCILLLH